MLDLQTLDTDRWVLTDQLCRELVLIITASVTDASEETSDLHPRLRTVLGPFFLLAEATLGTCQFLLILVEELRIAVGMPLRGDHHGLQAQVKPDLFSDHRQELDVLFDQDGNKVASRGILAHRDGRGLTSLGQGPRPVDVHRSIHLGQGQVLSIPLEGRRGVGSQSTHSLSMAQTH